MSGHIRVQRALSVCTCTHTHLFIRVGIVLLLRDGGRLIEEMKCHRNWVDRMNIFFICIINDQWLSLPVFLELQSSLHLASTISLHSSNFSDQNVQSNSSQISISGPVLPWSPDPSAYLTYQIQNLKGISNPMYKNNSLTFLTKGKTLQSLASQSMAQPIRNYTTYKLAVPLPLSLWPTLPGCSPLHFSQNQVLSPVFLLISLKSDLFSSPFSQS